MVSRGKGVRVEPKDLSCIFRAHLVGGKNQPPCEQSCVYICTYSYVEVWTCTPQRVTVKLGVVVHAFNSSIWEAETGKSLRSRVSWCTYWAPSQSRIHSETLFQKTNKKPKNYLSKCELWRQRNLINNHNRKPLPAERPAIPELSQR